MIARQAKVPAAACRAVKMAFIAEVKIRKTSPFCRIAQNRHFYRRNDRPFILKRRVIRFGRMEVDIGGISLRDQLTILDLNGSHPFGTGFRSRAGGRIVVPAVLSAVEIIETDDLCVDGSSTQYTA